jgi:hypothetical protein
LRTVHGRTIRAAPTSSTAVEPAARFQPRSFQTRQAANNAKTPVIAWYSGRVRTSAPKNTPGSSQSTTRRRSATHRNASRPVGRRNAATGSLSSWPLFSMYVG